MDYRNGFCPFVDRSYGFKSDFSFHPFHMNLSVYCFYHLMWIIFSPKALRKAKIVCNFGLSECSRVNSSHRGTLFAKVMTLDLQIHGQILQLQLLQLSSDMTPCIYLAKRQGFHLSRMIANNQTNPMKFCYNTSFPVPKEFQRYNPKDLDLSCKMGLDFWDCFGRNIFHLITKKYGTIIKFMIRVKALDMG